MNSTNLLTKDKYLKFALDLYNFSRGHIKSQKTCGKNLHATNCSVLNENIPHSLTYLNI